ncbi:DUF4198 domain-containing protein [Phenylobacterium sp.]|uniref:DUF4198 domain-containing protein n=1 Tax=Phenylobacterium sp. TaxID=1871053 RepID=UPI002869F00C|nr:DUF4198 domain-containing protein [Phenylobacterium sp.]
MTRSRSCAIAPTVVALLVALPGSAHELLLKPPKQGVHGALEIQVSNGDIDKSISSIDWRDVANVTVARAGEPEALGPSNWRVSGPASVLTIDASTPATYLLGVSTKPKNFEMSKAEFLDYIKEEHIEIATPEIRSDKVTERYSKHAISYLQVGGNLTGDYRRPLDYPMQIRMIRNPATLRVGDTARLEVLFHGAPLAGQLVLGGYEGFGHDAKGEPINKLSLRTDRRGIAAFRISNRGRWYAYLVHMGPLTDGSADYESFYATTLFDVRR